MLLSDSDWSYTVGRENVLLAGPNGLKRLIPIKDFGGEEIDGGWFISPALIKKYIEENLNGHRF